MLLLASIVCSFSLELTIKTIRVTLGPDSVPKNVMTDEAIALCEEQLVKQAMDESRALYEVCPYLNCLIQLKQIAYIFISFT